MKKIIIALVISLSITGCMTSSHIRDYEAACFYADLIHIMMDDSIIGNNVLDHYNKWYYELDSMKFKKLQKNDLDNYYWCY